MYFRALLVAIAAFLLFLCLLSIRHIPIVTGFYYGASFASLFAILVGMLLSGISRVAPRARPYAALAVVGIVATQIVNFWPINDGLAEAPQRGDGAGAHLRPGRPLAEPVPDRRGGATAHEHGSPQSLASLEAQAAPTVRSRATSSRLRAGYLVFELREIDRQLLRQNEGARSGGNQGADDADNEE